MRNFKKILNIMLVMILALTVFFQGINIKDLQEKTDYLFDEVLFLGGLVDSLDRNLIEHTYYEHIEKGGAE